MIVTVNDCLSFVRSRLLVNIPDFFSYQSHVCVVKDGGVIYLYFSFGFIFCKALFVLKKYFHIFMLLQNLVQLRKFVTKLIVI